MKEKKFILSEKRKKLLLDTLTAFNMDAIGIEDIFDAIEKQDKEFIKLLKETHQKLSDKHGSWADYDKEFKKEIDKLVGEELK